MAMGPKEIPAQPLASFEFAGSVLVTSIVRVPLIWESEFNNFDFGLGRSGLVDGSLAEISFGGELWIANSFGEIERFSLFAEPTTVENAMLERKCIKTRLHLAERVITFEQATPPSSREGGKKRGIADAGKMFKKLVLSVTHEPTDLNKVFQFSSEEDERKRLMGDRTATAAQEDSESDVAKIEHGTATTKDTLMQAQQRLAERGEKLSELGLKTEQMKKTSEDFYQTMKAFNEKNANKKWYEF
ncbi:Lethal(2) giant larvae protein 1 [Phytophthora boehmeriae]|uniref:Lethal(2) giant larvae protein 1 n=1 Tax=Phytophthora boehmeriae TaxID=109152 RepID=A0A8T1X135_9STRA|nr:Lethal(2) giant larvae protein 1 [Phytophthora boehmeriae]